MNQEFLNKARSKMEDIISFLQRDLDSISTGRASPKLLDTIKVDSYGSFSPLSQIANVSTPDASTVAVQVWDKSMVKPVEKAIINANLGFNPTVDGQLVRISIPKLSEERRVELSKLSKKYGEDKKVAIRNSRRDALDNFKKQEKELGASKDDIHSFSDVIQKITDEFVAKIDEMVAVKEKDLMKV
jgi:ribosome recycling factor